MLYSVPKIFEILTFGYFKGLMLVGRLMDFDELEIPSHCLAAYDLNLFEIIRAFLFVYILGHLAGFGMSRRKSSNFSNLGLVDFFPK